MANLLSVSDVVNVTVDLSPVAATYRNFGAGLILGDSAVVDVDERIRAYSDILGVTQDFGVNAPEYKAAVLHFAQSPRSNILYIGRWASAATKAVFRGRVLSAAERLLSLFTAVTSGAMFMYIDGVPRALTFSTWAGVSNLNGVAAIIQTALQAAVASSTCVYNSTYHRFEITCGTTGDDSKLSFAQAPTAFGTLTFGGQPTPTTDAVTINGVTLNFVASNPGTNDVLKGADLAETLANLAQVINSTADVELGKVTAVVQPGDNPTKVYIVSKTTGTGGNAYTLAKTGSVITVSGATLSGGTGTDVSALLGLRVTDSGRIAQGSAAESLAEAVAAVDDVSGDWYGLTLAAAAEFTDLEIIEAAQYIEANATSRIFGVTTMDPGVLDPVITTDIASKLKDLELKRTFVQFSSSSPYAATSLFARASTVNFNANRSTITLKFKQEPSVVAEELTKTQAATLKAKHCNVFAKYQNLTAIIQEGVMANGYYFDEVHGTDWLQNKLQEDVWNLLYTSTTKIPQTDDGMHQIVTVLNASMAAAVNNGLVAPGVWTGPAIGQLKYGDTMNYGYYVYAPLMASQSQADREARKAPPIQIAAKLAGAIHFADVLVTCNR
jgi:hypothetical protein